MRPLYGVLSALGCVLVADPALAQQPAADQQPMVEQLMHTQEQLLRKIDELQNRVDQLEGRLNATGPTPAPHRRAAAPRVKPRPTPPPPAAPAIVNPGRQCFPNPGRRRCAPTPRRFTTPGRRRFVQPRSPPPHRPTPRSNNPSPPRSTRTSPDCCRPSRWATSSTGRAALRPAGARDPHSRHRRRGAPLRVCETLGLGRPERPQPDRCAAAQTIPLNNSAADMQGGDFGMTARFSRFGIDTRTLTDWGTLETRLEGDFGGGAPTSSNARVPAAPGLGANSAPPVFRVLVGQANSLWNEGVFETLIDATNLNQSFIRQAQIRAAGRLEGSCASS